MTPIDTRENSGRWDASRQTDLDRRMMQRALFHAGRAQGATTPNPMVGAVVVTPDGVVVGQGYHHRAGEAHAEVIALDEAGERARGATLYVTLEPCCHYGRTGPCTARVLRAGIARVVVSLEDPNPLVRGRGIAELRSAQVIVDVGLLDAEAARLNRGFLTVQNNGRPYVLVKSAVSLDGRIAEAPGVRTQLTSAAANRRAQRLRASFDAIGVGAGTVLVDDPLLTVRECFRPRPFVRVVFDRRLRTPPAARLFSTLADGPVIILTRADTVEREPERARALSERGATIVPTTGDLQDGLRTLTGWNVSALLIEGGGELHAAMWEAGLVDGVCLVVAPRVVGRHGVPVFNGHAIDRAVLSPDRVVPLGPDVWMETDVHGYR